MSIEKMPDLPPGIEAREEKYRATLWSSGKTKHGPWRADIPGASKDLATLKQQRPPKKQRSLPKYVYKVVGFRKGYRAQGTMQKVQITGPFRASIEQASNDARSLGAATTLQALEKAKEKMCSKS